MAITALLSSFLESDMSSDLQKAPLHVIIEPFHGGSHKQLIDGLVKSFYPPDSVLVLSLPAKKWKWYASIKDAALDSKIAKFTDRIP